MSAMQIAASLVFVFGFRVVVRGGDIAQKIPYDDC